MRRLILSLIITTAIHAQGFFPFPGPGNPPSGTPSKVLINHTFAGSVTLGNFSTTAMDTTGANFCVLGISSILGTDVVSDSKGWTWTLLTRGGGAANSGSLIAYAFGTGGTNHVFNWSSSSSALAGSMEVECWSNITSFDQQNAGQSGAAQTTFQPGSITPTTNGQLIITASGTCAGSSTATVSVVTLGDQINWVSGQHCSGAIGHLVQGTAAAINPTWTWTNPDFISATIASFQ